MYENECDNGEFSVDRRCLNEFPREKRWAEKAHEMYAEILDAFPNNISP